jgi:hypothetical protein
MHPFRSARTYSPDVRGILFRLYVRSAESLRTGHGSDHVARTDGEWTKVLAASRRVDTNVRSMRYRVPAVISLIMEAVQDEQT